MANLIAFVHTHIHTPTQYKTHTYTHPHNTKPTHTHTHTIQNPHIHTPTHYKTHTPTQYKTHTIQNPHIHTHTQYKTHTYTHPHITKPWVYPDCFLTVPSLYPNPSWQSWTYHILTIQTIVCPECVLIILTVSLRYRISNLYPNYPKSILTVS